jgi:hypothetical protein
MLSPELILATQAVTGHFAKQLGLQLNKQEQIALQSVSSTPMDPGIDQNIK